MRGWTLFPWLLAIVCGGTTLIGCSWLIGVSEDPVAREDGGAPAGDFDGSADASVE